MKWCAVGPQGQKNLSLLVHAETMAKEEILHRLKVTGQLQTMDDTKEWRDAFGLYNSVHGMKFKPKDFCQKCFNLVSSWLQDIKE